MPYGHQISHYITGSNHFHDPTESIFELLVILYYVILEGNNDYGTFIKFSAHIQLRKNQSLEKD